MVDRRILTFLRLCETMSYHETAAQLNMTQPAVTQQIHALESEYGCKLFFYDRRSLHRTDAAEKLAVYARSMLSNERSLRRELLQTVPQTLRIGATKTIGEFVIGGALSRYLAVPERTLSLTVDNTAVLLRLIDAEELDFALIEGAFDKRRYGHTLLRSEPFVGICAADHPFAGRSVPIGDILCETLLLREEGSGTRAIFERMLADYGYSPESFRRVVSISNFGVICQLAAAGTGISFVYRAVAESRSDLASFTLQDLPASFQFNFVYLGDTRAERLAADFRAESGL